MRHAKEKRPLGRTSAHRDALMRNLVTALIEHGRITTTLQKAKELRRVADRMVTLGKRGDLAARRLALRRVRSAAVVKKLFSEVALRSESRAGGYTRILHLGTRPGDNADMAIIELVDRPQVVVEEGAKGKGKKAAPKKARPTGTVPKRKPEQKRTAKGSAGAKGGQKKAAPQKAMPSGSGS